MPDTAPHATDDTAHLPPYLGLPLSAITLVSSAILAAQAGECLLTADSLGFDTESRPTFRKGEISTGPHLIQLATDDHAWLFPAGLPFVKATIKAVLESPQVRKVGFGLGNDRSALHARLGITLTNTLDLGELLRGPSHRGTVGARTAVARFFGQRMQKSKKTSTSNWANPQLSEQQMRYAANDAHVALQVYRAMSANEDWKTRWMQNVPVTHQGCA